jgi:glycolate oxidase
LEERVLFSYDAATFRQVPELVVMPRSEEDVIQTVQFARKYHIPISPRGAGTGMSGGAIPNPGAMIIGFERMNRIWEINQIEKYAVVEPGVLTGDLQEKVLEMGLFYPPDPSSYLVSTLGGNIAEGAGGLRCAKYGVTKNYVLGLRVVTMLGEVITTGALAEDPRFPDLTPLFIGSEGTLGIVTIIVLRLIKAPECTQTMLAFFPTGTDAAEAVSTILKERLLPSVMEFLDRMTLKAITGYVPLEIPEQAEAMLLIEVDGSEADIKEQLPLVMECCQGCQGFQMLQASEAKKRNRLWELRRSVSPSLARLASGKINEDVCVPRGEMIRLVEACQELSKHTGLMIPVYGHAADGNLHVNVMYDRNNQDQIDQAQFAVEQVFQKTLELGGTLSGEHGIGRTKRDYLPMQFSPYYIECFRQIKQVWDPEGLMNPGVMYPLENSAENT